MHTNAHTAASFVFYLSFSLLSLLSWVITSTNKRDTYAAASLFITSPAGFVFDFLLIFSWFWFWFRSLFDSPSSFYLSPSLSNIKLASLDSSLSNPLCFQRIICPTPWPLVRSSVRSSAHFACLSLCLHLQTSSNTSVLRLLISSQQSSHSTTTEP